jgi:hypothetical protein
MAVSHPCPTPTETAVHRPPHNLLLAVSVLTVAATALTAPARAQEPRRLAEPDSIPLELATALVSAGGFGGEPQILVGSVPEWIAPRIFVPAGGRVLGAAFLGTTMVAVVTMSSASDSVLAEFRRGLMQRGWAAAPPAPVYNGGGFRPATMSVAATPFARDVLCSDQQMLTTSATRRRGIATDVTLRITTAPGYSPCHPVQPYQPVTRSPLPTVYNPVGANDARMNGECPSSMAMVSGATSTLLRTPMTGDALLDHYGKQLIDSGWTGQGDRNTVTGRTWTRPDSAGNALEVSITVTTSGKDAGCRDLNMQVRTLRKP